MSHDLIKKYWLDRTMTTEVPKEPLQPLIFTLGRKPPMTGGRKDDGGKLPWHLLPFDALKGVITVLQFGAAKYDERNWEKGMDWDRVFGGVMRHLTDWWNKVDHGKGPGKDKDTGYSELWHAACGILFLVTYEIRNKGKDTRPDVG